MVYNSTTLPPRTIFVSLRNRTGEERRRQNTRAITCVFRRDLVLYRKICLKENEVWRKVVSNKIIVTLVKQGLLSFLLSRPVALVHYYHTRFIREVCTVPMDFSSTLVF